MEGLFAAEQLVDVDFKDESPIKTVEKIRNIVESIGFEIEENWKDANVPYCYSLGVKIKGTGFRVNGKGLTPEFARASGYGELMERLQLGFVGRRAVQKDGVYSMSDTHSVKVPAEQLIKANLKSYERIAARLKEWNGNVILPKEIVMQFADTNGDVDATPFVNLIDGKTEYLPVEMRKNMYTSNGCAAGNTIEEAFVQALSEIVERYYRMQIISKKICTPEIPDEELKKYKVAYEIIEYVRAQGYKVVVKDCSLGEKFPMVCVCYVDEKSGRYHTHFGAYPIFEIALERALTETFQGRGIDNFAIYETLLLNSDEKDLASNMTQELIYGTSSRMPEFFVGDVTYTYNKSMGFKGKNNKELLKECIEFFRKQGYDIFARDASCLGFPTCQIIIPGYSETYIHRVSKKTNESRYLPSAIKTFRNPSKVSTADMTGMLMHMNEMSNFFAGDGKRNAFLSNAKLMANLNGNEEKYFLSATMAYVNYAFGKLSLVESNVSQMLSCKYTKKEDLLICLKRYLSMKNHKYNPDLIKQTLEFLHTKETVNKLYGYVENNKNPLEEFVLHCDMQCSDDCEIKDRCHQKQAQILADIINDAEKKLSFEEFSKTVNKLIN